MGEELKFNNCTLWSNGIKVCTFDLKDIQINKLKINDIETKTVDAPFKSFTGEIQITKFKKSKGLRKLFLEMGRMIDHNKYRSYKKHLKRVDNRNKLYNKLKLKGRGL